jgi:hypothetical protein
MRLTLVVQWRCSPEGHLYSVNFGVEYIYKRLTYVRHAILVLDPFETFPEFVSFP